jgi:hypothetical protein
MEEIKDGGICPLTGWQISDSHRRDYTWYYTVSCHSFSFNIWVERECLENENVQEYRYLLRWLLFNGKLKIVRRPDDFEDKSNLITINQVYSLLSESYIPKTPKEKVDNFLLLLNKIFPWFEGEIVKRNLFNLAFFPNEKEFDIYYKHLINSGYISSVESSRNVVIYQILVREAILSIDVTFKGIEYLASLAEHGRDSKNCFIAMSFSSKGEIVAIKEAIKSAVNEAKYNPIIINEKHIDSDQTINDAIIAEIKRAKFVVADFTEQKSGVYFEAGFALGLGIPVIYCCEEEDFKKNSHFDVNHYPHILYKTPEQLRKGLIDKIRAWID